MSLFPINDTDKLACIEREIKMRLQVYPRWIESGRMTREKADHEISVMQEIAEDYRRKLK
jgi:hypothetical protein